MKFYYLVVGLAGLAASFYLNSTCTAEPGWAAFLIAYACGTSVGTAISIHLRGRHNAKTGGFR